MWDDILNNLATLQLQEELPDLSKISGFHISEDSVELNE
jgi:hypothetical protein